MGHSAVHECLQTLRRWYKLKRREAPPAQPTCSSGALWSVGCFGCANSRLSSVIAQKQMCAKYRTLPSTPIRPSFRCSFHFTPSSLFREKCYPFLQTLQTIFPQLSTHVLPIDWSRTADDRLSLFAVPIPGCRRKSARRLLRNNHQRLLRGL